MSRSLRQRTILLLLIAALLPACASGVQQAGRTVAENPKTVLGGLTGAAAGALIGAAADGGPAAIVGGALLGGLLGGGIGNHLDQRDRDLSTQAMHHALETLPSSQSSTWRNPDSGNSGTVTPTRAYRLADGAYCREFRQEVVIGGERQEAYGTACRQPDGSWRVKS